jgi:hypothetical protein
MGKNKTESTQTTQQILPSNQQTNVDLLMQGAYDWFNQGGRQFFPGDLVADFDPTQTQGQNMLVNFATGLGTDLVGNAISANKLMMDPMWLDPSNNPYFTGVADDLTKRRTSNFLENILPQIGGGAIAAGQFGGTPAEIGEALAGERFAQTLGADLNTLALGQQGLGMQTMMDAIRNSPMLLNMGMVPGQVVSGVGDVRQTQAQNEIQADVARHEFEQNEPMAQLEFLKNITGRFGDYGGTTTTKATQESKSSPINQALGAAMMAASLWNPMTSMFAGLGSTAGAGIGSGFLNQALAQGIPSPFTMQPGNFLTNSMQNLYPSIYGGTP